jgi:hypothetical protein
MPREPIDGLLEQANGRARSLLEPKMDPDLILQEELCAANTVVELGLGGLRLAGPILVIVRLVVAAAVFKGSETCALRPWS